MNPALDPAAEPGGMGWLIFLAEGFAIASLLALVFTALAAWIGRRGESPSGPRWGVTLGLGLGALLAHEVVREAFTGERPRQVLEMLRLWAKDGGAFPLFAGDAHHWLPWVVLAATIVGLFDGDRPAPRWARWENRALLIGLLLWFVIGPLVGGSLSVKAGTIWLIGLGAGLLTWWSILDARAERLGPAMPLVLHIPAAALPAALHWSDAAILSALAAGFAAVLGAVWVASWVNRRMNLARGAVPIFATSFAGLVLCGMFYNDMAKPAVALLAIAPLISFVDRIGPVARLSPWKVAAVRIVAVAMPVVAAVGWVYATAPAAS